MKTLELKDIIVDNLQNIEKKQKISIEETLELFTLIVSDKNISSEELVQVVKSKIELQQGKGMKYKSIDDLF